MQGPDARQVADAQLEAGGTSSAVTPIAGATADDESLYPFYLGRDGNRQHGKLNRTLQSLNPFKVCLDKHSVSLTLLKRYCVGTLGSISRFLTQKTKAGGGWFNPEEFTASKREWAKQFSGDGKASDNYKLFESFFIAGLPPTVDIKSVTANAQTTKTGLKHPDPSTGYVPAFEISYLRAEIEPLMSAARHDHVHMRFAPETTKETEHRGSRGKPLDAQILFSYPPEKPVSSEVASFCFPHGVQPTLLERTPSLSSLNEVIYGQRYQHSDSSSYIFLMKVADNMPLYGVCCCMDELVHRPPAILSSLYPRQNGPLSRYLVSAPRCYCLLTHYPFFSLHMKVLHMVMGLERLERITGFTEEAMRLAPESPFAANLPQNTLPSPSGKAAAKSRELNSTSATAQRSEASASGSQRRRDSSNNAKDSPGEHPESRPSGSFPSALEAARSRGAIEALALAIKSASTSSNGQDSNASEEVGPRPASFTTAQLSSRPTHRRAASAAGLPPISPNSSGIDKISSARLPSSISRASARLRQALDAQAEASLRIGEEGPETAFLEADQGVESSSDSGTSYRTARSNLMSSGPANGAEDAQASSPVRLKQSSSTGALSRLASGSSPSDERCAHQRGDQDLASSSNRDAVLDSEKILRGLLKSESLQPHRGAPRKGGPSGPAGALQVVQAYYEESVPQPGQEFEFNADDTLQPVHFLRPPLKLAPGAPEHVHRTQVANAEAEAAAGLRSWTISVLCRCLSLDNILVLLTAVLLEQQMVLFCPNIGLLSTAVLSLIPLIRPFAWQSLLLPILPALDKMLDLLEAPVPFILGVQYKTSEVASRCSSLIRVNVYKDSIKNAEKLPSLPGNSALHSMLEPAYNTLRALGRHNAHTRPTYSVSNSEKSAAEDFLQTAEAYLSSLCAKLHLHTITDVQTVDRVSLLMKDSFIESFPAKDRNFVRMFVETQMFSVYCDTVMA